MLLDALQAGGNRASACALDARRIGETLLSVPIIGGDEQIDTLARAGTKHFIIGVGGTRNNAPRGHLYDRAIRAGLQPLTVVHPSAVVSPHATLAPGVQVLAGAIINAGAKVRENSIINSGAIVEHDCLIERHVHIATGARLASTVRVGEFAHIGAGATVRQLITIGEAAVVGAGAVVVKDVAAATTVVGVPAKELK